MLIFIIVEDHGSVLSAPIWSLLVHSCRIVVVPENLQEFLVGNDGRVIGDLDHFCMTRGVRADILIRWVLHLPAHVSDSRGEDTFGLEEGFLDSPEAASTEGSQFHRR